MAEIHIFVLSNNMSMVGWLGDGDMGFFYLNGWLDGCGDKGVFFYLCVVGRMG